MKLGLGTAQFGFDYGISNSRGRVPGHESRRILALAAECGIRYLDTAPTYGTSEAVVGEYLPAPSSFSIVTKTPCFRRNEITGREEAEVEAAFRSSLFRLRQPSVYGLLVHDSADLFTPGGQRIYDCLRRIKSEGLVQKIGASVYDAEQISAVLSHFDVDLLQLPVNVFDQRLIVSGCLADLKRRGIELHARSIFLQGLLLMHPHTLPPFFDSVRDHVRAYRTALDDRGISPLQAALRFAADVSEIDVILCGVARASELQQIRDALRAPYPTLDLSRFAVSDPAVLNPSTWVL